MPIKSNHDIYLFNHRNFTNYIYDNRYGIYVPDRLLLYFTLYKNKLEDWKIIAILAVEKETGSFQLTPTRKSFFIITKSYGTRLGVESYISAYFFYYEYTVQFFETAIGNNFCDSGILYRRVSDILLVQIEFWPGRICFFCFALWYYG